MSDRELLELAAKAAGIDTSHKWNADRMEMIPPVISLVAYRDGSLMSTGWNPLEDDGDALRLAVALQLTVWNEHISAGAAYCTGRDDCVYPEVDSGTSEDFLLPEDYVATRRAIVLAAAEIGKAMQEQSK